MMGKIIYEGTNFIDLGTVSCEEDLKPIPGKINHNPPPEDGRCECCGKHISELTPFGGTGDPVAGDFTDALLVKKFRPKLSSKRDEIVAVQKVWKMAGRENGLDSCVKVLVAKLDRKTGKVCPGQVNSFEVEPSWECNDCSALDQLGYFDKCHEVSRGKRRSNSQTGFTKTTDRGMANGLKEEGK
jgi:hypothetical protein